MTKRPTPPRPVATQPPNGPVRSRRPEQRVVTDVRAIRALAHPARLAALDALSGTELTATQCAAIAGISPSAMSYHLRALEKWGIVERVETAVDGRERPWRTYPGGWSIDGMPDAATAAATATLAQLLLGRISGELDTWLKNERNEPEPWRRASGVDNSQLWLSDAEAQQLRDLHSSWIDERRGRTAQNRPDGARRVRVMQVVVPQHVD